jgi:TRAP-type C4-dicarboxylate transport system substrate-binding protein
MRSYIRYILIICILAVVVVCPACTKDLPTVQNIINEQQERTLEPLEIIISHNQNVNTPEDIAAHAMQSKLQELLGQQATVTVYADYQMGNAREQIEAMQLGRIHITIQSASIAASFVDDMKVFLLPYLFSSNADEVKTILDSSLEKDALERIGMRENTTGVSGLGLWFGGYKLFTFHGDDYKNIHSPADFQGLQIAVPDNALLEAQYRHWGAKTIVMDSAALYGALAQHIADGSEATTAQIVSNYLYEVQHNIVQAYYSPEIYVVLADAAWFTSLPIEIQTAIIEAEQYGKETLYETLAKQEPLYLESISQIDGVQYYMLDEDAQHIFRASVRSLYTEQLAGNAWQTEYVERLKEYFK